MKTQTKFLCAFGLLTLMGCSVASSGDVEAPQSESETRAVSEQDATSPANPDLGRTIEARRAEAAAKGRSMLERADEIEEALRRHDLDPAAAHREARAIEAAKDDAERSALLAAFTEKYASVTSELEPTLPMADDGIAKAMPMEIPSTDGYETRAHTACTTTTDTPPYPSSTPSFGTFSDGYMSVRATGGFADGQTSINTIRTGQLAVSAADSTLHVSANFALTSGRIEVWSGLFGFADAGVSLTLAVKSYDGRVICTAERKLADRHVIADAVNYPIPAATYSLGCTGARPRDASLGVFAEVSLGAWNGVGGIAGAHAEAVGRLTSVTGRNCVEPGIFFDAEGLCAAPVLPVSGSSVRINACNADPNGKWDFSSTAGTIRHRSTGMCLTVDPFAPSIWYGTNVTMRPCSGSLRQRWTRLADGKLRSQAAASPFPGFCLDGFGGGGPGAHLQMWACLSPAGKNQRWFFQP